ncbi:hypothetical protein GLOIN_2v1880756 [Rhizophagus irregularis DAOM 181602=DAOM 197198]|nr:hypothetical protein GLOIN_2v1880756 [Rhizophagus irregularis DAOM 181602=DAOM 197198]
MKEINFDCLIHIINELRNDKKTLYTCLLINKIWKQEIYKLFVNNCKDIKNLIWKTYQPLSLFPGAINCFSKLYSLSIDPDNINSNSIYEMSKICKNLNILSIYNCSKDHHGLISLIDVQKNLEKLNIYHNDINKKGNCQELSKALARKGDTINEIHLDLFNNIPSSFMISLNNLKRIDIFNQDIREEEININEFQQYLAISKFPKLEFFNVKGLLCFKEFSLLIKGTRGNLSHLLIDIKTDEFIIKNTGIEDWGYSIDALERFFQSFKEKNLISFNIIHNRNFYITDDHKEIIRKYINEGVIRYSNYM